MKRKGKERKMNILDASSWCFDFFGFLGILILVWNTIRIKTLSCVLDGRAIEIPTDEVKEAYRRAALAEASRLAGGRRVNLEMEWVGKKLVVTTKKEK